MGDPEPAQDAGNILGQEASGTMDVNEPPSGSKAPPANPEFPLIFHGETREYFRIWIANVALTLLTFGIYAAWAKVRRRRYFRGCLDLMGHRFEYTASPVRLLVGNVLVLALFFCYSIIGIVYPWVVLVTLAVGVALLPWIVVRSLAFNAHNTVYRGMRFRFSQNLTDAAVAYVFKGLLLIPTIGIYFPAWDCGRHQFIVSRHRFGTGYFRFSAVSGQFYSAYLPAFGMILLSMVAAGFSMAAANLLGKPALALPAAAVIYLPAVLVARGYVHAEVFNAVWNGTSLDGSRFKASMKADVWIKLQVVNWAAILGTLGLMYPWAAIRSARYVASCLSFLPAEDFWELRNFAGSGGGAVGETAAEFLGLDFGL